MSEVRLSSQELASRGEKIYEQQIRDSVEVEHRGEYVVIDVSTGEFEVAEDDLVATRRLRERLPEALTYGLRVGHRAAYRLGGFSKADTE